MACKSPLISAIDWPMFFDTVQLPDGVKFAMRFGPTGDTAFLITEKGEIFSAGNNTKSCLGVGSTATAVNLTRVDSLCGQKVVSITAGIRLQVMAITADGRLFTWGNNCYNVLGHGDTTDILTPKLCQSLQDHKVKQVACGDTHTLALTDDHLVFAWGYNASGQVGSGDTSQQSTPMRVQNLPEKQNVDAIGCTYDSSFAITSGGELYAWGQNDHGELGIGSTENQHFPVKVHLLENVKVKAMANGYHHTLILTTCGRVFSFGCNGKGQLGIGHTDNTSTPTIVDLSDLKVEEVGASSFSNFSVARTIFQKVFAWGEWKHRAFVKPRLTSCKSLNEAFLYLSSVPVTCKPVTSTGIDEDSEHISTIKCLEEHFDNEEVSDVQFIIDGKTIFGHASFLRMCSPYLKAMLSASWTQNNREVKVTGQSYKTFRAYLKFLYTNTLDVFPSDAVDLLALANEYCERALKIQCEHFIHANVNVENAFDIYAAAKRLNAEKLEEYTFRFLIRHLTEAIKTEAYTRVDPVIVKEFISRAAEAEAFKQ